MCELRALYIVNQQKPRRKNIKNKLLIARASIENTKTHYDHACR